ncbi:flagellar biosynthesis protein FlhF [Pseudomaricurvus sp.]|uniref:flagellar biosynthesis protein FlhF n=1 Tax=Pseudomaricurvus sp. TaxID=2004510 RepID=UPI003F6A55D3
MSVKRFVASDMRRALELVRQEMGPEAIILSSKRVKQGVEILTSAPSQTENSASVSPINSHLPNNSHLSRTESVQQSDVPMGSDGAWHDQLAMDEVVNSHDALRNSQPAPEPSLVAPEYQSRQFTPNTTTPAFRGSASGKTPAELAEEIEQARIKMMAAKKQQEQDEMPIGMSGARQSAPAAENMSYAQSVSHEQARSRYEDHSGYDDRPGYGERSAYDNRSRYDSAEADRYRSDRAHADSYRGDSYNETMHQQDQQRQLQSLQSELADMRLLLEEQLTRMANTPQMASPLHSGLMRRLKHMGLSDRPAEAVVKRIKKHSTIQEAWADTLATLSRYLPANASDQVMNGGVFAFVGPTGVGKTTTIAKLAARYVLEHGAENVALITTDTYRIAAHDQLRSLGRILNVQVKVVEDHNDLPAVLRSLKGCPLVLIDTAGFRLGDAQLKEQLQALDVIPEVQKFLVMACNSQLQMMKATIHAHQNAKLQGCVLTKLDESSSLGEAMSVLLEHKLAVHYTTNGQEIPQDIEVAKGHKLVSKAVALMKTGMGSQAPAQEAGGSFDAY